MNNNARNHIYNRLRAAAAANQGAPDAGPIDDVTVPQMTRDEKIERLKSLMGAVRTEVHRVTSATWVDQLKTIAREKQLSNLLIAPETSHGKAVQNAWSGDADGLPSLETYGENIEAFKDELFQTDAALTATIGGIADPGAIILWPDKTEPRLMSLVPHIHIALLEADNIYASPAEAFQGLGWPGQIPTNALLISGPSKTADIEFILTFGVHGPKELVLLIIDG